MPKLLYNAEWPLDVVASSMAWLDVCDLSHLRMSQPAQFDCMMAELMHKAHFVYEANRILTEPELAWLERCGIPVHLLEEKHVMSSNTDKQLERWLRNGVLHRDGDLPAVILTNRVQKWYRNGKLHRDGDLPAFILTNCVQKWYRNGKLHRDGDQPAVVWDGDWGGGHSSEWYIDGMLHRGGDQPAVVTLTTQEWYLDGKPHRDGDQPAVILADGARYWYLDGKLHRGGDQPAVILADETQEWYCDGKRHRGGNRPAIIRANGSKVWYLLGRYIKRTDSDLLPHLQVPLIVYQDQDQDQDHLPDIVWTAAAQQGWYHVNHLQQQQTLPPFW